MKRLSYKAILIQLVLLVAPASYLNASSLQSPDPTRFINGELLAHHVFKDVVTNWPATSQGVTPEVSMPELIGGLYEGQVLGRPGLPAEIRLEMWMMTRPDYSITPLQLSHEAIKLSDGNIFDALLLCWNVLRNDWKHTDTRNLFPRTMKLADITGELSNFDGNDQVISGKHIKTIRGDNFSAWYHFYGTAIAAYFLAEKAMPMPARVFTGLLIFLEEKWFHNEFIDSKKRIALDNAGVSFGLNLFRLARRYQTWESFSDVWQRKAAQGSYVTSRPDIFDASWHLKPDQLPKHFGTNETKVSGKKSLMDQSMTMLQLAADDPRQAFDRVDALLRSVSASKNEKFFATGLLGRINLPEAERKLREIATNRFHDERKIAIQALLTSPFITLDSKQRVASEIVMHLTKYQFIAVELEVLDVILTFNPKLPASLFEPLIDSVLKHEEFTGRGLLKRTLAFVKLEQKNFSPAVLKLAQTSDQTMVDRHKEGLINEFWSSRAWDLVTVFTATGGVCAGIGWLWMFQ